MLTAPTCQPPKSKPAAEPNPQPKLVDGHQRVSPQGVTTWESASIPGGITKPISEIEATYFDLIGNFNRGEGPGPAPATITLAGVELVRFGPETVTHENGHEVYRREILGGVLAKTGGHFEFMTDRNGPDPVFTVKLNSFRPRLPLWPYEKLQLPLHRWITQMFLKRFNFAGGLPSRTRA